MQKNERSQLALALRKKLLVRFASALERGTISGYVLNIGPQFFLIALVSDGIRYNGFQCYRLSDVRKLHVPDKYARFHEAVLKKRGVAPLKKPPVDVSSLAELLLTADRSFPLVTIHREKVDASVCSIGRVVEVKNGFVTLLEIGPDASWDNQLETYRLSEITRVDFGGDYEGALHLIGAKKYQRAVDSIWGKSNSRKSKRRTPLQS
ncbi:MAG: hypothetical protein WBE13_01000 [Candidatus Acidiferrum sp.]